MTDEIARRNDMIQMRRAGATLADIGAKYGVSRERARQIIDNRVTSTEAAAATAGARVAQVRAALTQPMTLAELADRVGFSQHLTSSLVPDDVRHLVLSPQTVDKRFSEGDLLARLREAAAVVEGPLTATRYNTFRDADPDNRPTIAVYAARFGSWSAACAAAGVRSGEAPGARVYERRHSDDDLLRFVREFLDSGLKTVKDWDQWRMQRPGVPSLSLLRIRLGAWNDIKRAAWRL